MSNHLFQKGEDVRRCKKPTGRPKGSKNKPKHADDFRSMIAALLDDNWHRIERGICDMDDKAFTRFAVQYLIRLIVPNPVDDIMRLSDADFDKLITRLKEQTNGSYKQT